MTTGSLLLAGLTSILVSITVVWMLSVRIRNAGIVDIFWGLGFVILGWVYYLASPAGRSWSGLIVAVCLSIWGVRLSWHIFTRNWGKPEDFRYAAFRRTGGEGWWWKSYFKVFILQAILLWLIGMPAFAASTSANSVILAPLAAAGVLVWLAGVAMESVADTQLASFRGDPANKGRVLQTGLWRYSRHPNYFGDALQWWGIFLVAASAGGWWTVYAPAMMTFLLIRISGVTLLEKTMASRPGYVEYMKRTSAFVPWIPRNER